MAISPENFIPPSDIIGILNFFATLYVSEIACNCGTPTPATILVVQIDPGPIPTFNESAPALIKSFAASAVAILPTITGTEGNCFLTFFKVSITF